MTTHYLLTTFISLLLCTCARAQNIIESSLNVMRHRDVLNKNNMDIDITKSISTDNFHIDISCKVISDIRILQSFKEYKAPDEILSVENGNRTIFLQTNDTVYIIRHENNQEYIDYDIMETWLKFPMKRKDVISGVFHGHGTYCDKQSVRRFGSYCTKAETSGVLTLPDGNILKDCLCVHTTRLVSNIFTPIDSTSTACVFTVDSIMAYMSTDADILREEVYRIYAKGYRYPIIEQYDMYTGTDTMSSPIRHNAYYNSIESQSLLSDAANNALRNTHENSTRDYGNMKGNSTGGTICHILTQDNESQILTIKIQSQEDMKAGIILSDTNGIVYDKRDIYCHSGEEKYIRIPYSGLRYGQYAIHIKSDNGYEHSEKLFIK